VSSLYLLAIEVRFYLLFCKVKHQLLHGTHLSEPKIGQLDSGSFLDDSFLTILKEKPSWIHMVECLDT
jgi:hypothetical protein